MQISAEQISEIRDRIDILKIVERSVRLSKRGRRWTGLCPFHSEKTPSFGVSPDKQLFHCFGCGVGGDVFDFVMRMEGLEFPQAVRQLAAEAGVTLPERRQSPQEAQRAQERAALLALNEAVQRIYADQLRREPEAQRYLREDRGLSAETVERFGLGWAPNRWGFLGDALGARGLSRDAAEKVGLLGRNRNDKRFDRLRGRVVFPIGAPSGGILGFGGRRADWVDPDAPKYLNSPESPIYHKSSILYGLDLAKGDIRRARQALLVEGYLDVIALAQAGFGTAVAGCGTALTAEHARLLKRYTPEVITLYDGDAAGQEAARKAALLLLQAGLRVRVAALPSGEDPDSLVRDRGPEALKQLLRAAPAAVDFFLSQARASAGGGGVAGAIHAAQTVRPLLTAISDPLEREVAMQAAASQLGLDVRNLQRHLSGGETPPKAVRPAPKTRTIRPNPMSAVEKTLLALMLKDRTEVWNALDGWRDRGCDPQLLLAGSAGIVRDAVALIDQDRVLGAPALLDKLRAREHPSADIDALRAVLMDERSDQHPVEECVRQLVRGYTTRRLAALKQQLQGPLGDADSEALLQEVVQVTALKQQATQ